MSKYSIGICSIVVEMKKRTMPVSVNSSVSVNSMGISFHFPGEDKVVVTTQQDGDLAGVG